MSTRDVLDIVGATALVDAIRWVRDTDSARMRTALTIKIANGSDTFAGFMAGVLSSAGVNILASLRVQNGWLEFAIPLAGFLFLFIAAASAYVIPSLGKDLQRKISDKEAEVQAERKLTVLYPETKNQIAHELADKRNVGRRVFYATIRVVLWTLIGCCFAVWHSAIKK